MKKLYKNFNVSQLLVEPESGFLEASRPIEMEADVTVNDFGDGNSQWESSGLSGTDDFTVTFN